MKPLPNDFPDDIRQRVNSVPRPGKAQAPLEFEWIENATVTKRKDELISGVAGLGEIIVLHADPKVGKTQLAAFTSSS